MAFTPCDVFLMVASAWRICARTKVVRHPRVDGSVSGFGSHPLRHHPPVSVALHLSDQSEKKMTTLTVSSKYQIVLPVQMRANLGIKPGDKLHAIEFAARIELVPVRSMHLARGSLRGIDTTVERDLDHA